MWRRFRRRRNGVLEVVGVMERFGEAGAGATHPRIKVRFRLDLVPLPKRNPTPLSCPSLPPPQRAPSLHTSSSPTSPPRLANLSPPSDLSRRWDTTSIPVLPSPYHPPAYTHTHICGRSLTSRARLSPTIARDPERAVSPSPSPRSTPSRRIAGVKRGRTRSRRIRFSRR